MVPTLVKKKYKNVLLNHIVVDIKAVRPVEAKTVYIVFIHVIFLFFFFLRGGKSVCFLHGALSGQATLDHDNF